MKVVGVFEFGGPEKLRVAYLPDPHAGPGEVRVRVRAAAVNPADTLIRAGDVRFYDNHPRPIVPGMDASGVVDEIGPDTKTDFVVGDHVMAIVFPPEPTGGAYAEYLVLPAHRVIQAPSGTTYAEAATVGMNGLTARHALDSLRLPAGSTVAVTGAAGAVGSFVVSLAKRDGYRVIADARPADEELVRSCRADIVVARGGDVADRILAAAPSGVDGVLDTALMGSVLLPAIRDGGSMIPFRAIGERGMSGPVADDRVRVSVANVRKYYDECDKLEEIRALAYRGVLKARVAKVFPADQAADAHRLLEAGGSRGRPVIEF